MGGKGFYNYIVFSDGSIFNKDKKMKPSYRCGYEDYSLWINKKRVHYQTHILVYKLFIGDILRGYDVHHKDGNKLNNDYRNLELIDHKIHASFHLKGKEYNSKNWEITYPNGNKIVVFNLEKFCRENGLNSSKMGAVANNKEGRTQHLGYKCKKIKES